MESDLRDLPRSRPADASSATRPIGRGRPAAALISVCLGFFVIQLDVTIVNVALPALQGEIGGYRHGCPLARSHNLLRPYVRSIKVVG